jgi:dihydroorotate dehydrogenase
MSVYESAVRPLLFRLDAERAHNLTLAASALGGRSALVRRAAGRALTVRDPRLETSLAGLPLSNPLGLAAGFDKNARAVPMLGALGFGHLEIGSVSADASDGNPQPRLFRVPQDEAIVVAYGVPNDGAQVVRERLTGPRRVPVGVNLVKTNDPARPAAGPEVYEDYAASLVALQDRADYVALNLSCPNSAADKDFFDDLTRLDELLVRLAQSGVRRPLILKLKPTRDAGVLREIVAIADGHPFVSGFAINLPSGKPADLNVTVPRDSLEKLPGAVGGPPVEAFVNAILGTLKAITGDRYALIAAGGVTTAEAAYTKLKLGANAVQLYTGLVYHGPGLVKRILTDLLALLERDGYDDVAQISASRSTDTSAASARTATGSI